MTAARPAARPVPATPAQGAQLLSGEQITVRRLILRYVATGLVVLVAVSVATVYASRTIGTEEAINDAIRATTLVAEVAVQPTLTDAAVQGDPAALAAVDQSVRAHVVRDSLVRVKLWDRTGRIFYSDEPRLIGQRFALRDDELAVLDTGVPRAEISDLTDPENQYEERAVELLEVYERVETPTGTPVLVEAYFRYAGVSAGGRAPWRRFGGGVRGAGARRARCGPAAPRRSCTGRRASPPRPAGT